MTRTTERTALFKRAVGVFKNREDVEKAIRDLKNANYDMGRVSLIARNVSDVKGAEEITEKHGNEAKEGAGIGAVTGTVLGGLGGLLVGLGTLAIPGIGPVLVAGELATLGTTAAGAGIGAVSGGLVGALAGMGIPEEKAKIYEKRVKAGDYLLMVTGNDEQVRHADEIMHKYNIREFGIFDASDVK
ncbi:MAG: signal transduction histidine kinase (STHK), LytS [Spirulinaceae cyanobacterium]